MAQEVANRDLHRVVGVCFLYRRSQGPYRYLALKRRSDLAVYPGLWTIPGGGMILADYQGTPKTSPDGWEDPLELAVRREVLEEAGAVIGPLRYLSNFSFIRPDGIPVFGVRFASPYQFGQVRIDPKDSTEYAWITAGEASSFSFLGNISDELRSLDALLLKEARRR
jgi:8-oxo-dGTP pyrophosphatase MutT (NUDIX family)